LLFAAEMIGKRRSDRLEVPENRFPFSVPDPSLVPLLCHSMLRSGQTCSAVMPLSFAPEGRLSNAQEGFRGL